MQPIWFDSAEPGAPTLNNAAGSLLEVLRSCLQNGFNLKTVTSIAVASGVATATCSTHGYSSAYGKLVLIAGCSEAALNGRKQPTSTGTNAFTFPAVGVADGTYTGTITARRAPLGWVEEFNAANISIFKRTAVEATAMKLRVQDNNTSGATGLLARVLMVESASSTTVFGDRSPTTAQLSGGGYVPKGSADDAAAKLWTLVGDGRSFYVWASSLYTPSLAGIAWFFGDVVPYFSPDPYFCALCAGSAASPYSMLSGSWLNGLGNGPRWAARALTATGTAVPLGLQQNAPSVFGGVGLQANFDSVVVREPVFCGAFNNSSLFTELRGHWPGLAEPLADKPFASLGPNAVVGIAGKQYLSVLTQDAGGTGNALVQLSGEWF
jgi:hypothetical protein